MPGRPALLTQAEVARVIRAAKREGVATVEVKPTGAILIHLSPPSPQATEGKAKALAERKEVVL